MLPRSLTSWHKAECALFRLTNRHFDNKLWNMFFSSITHAGGAVFTIATVLFLLLVSHGTGREAAMAAAFALAGSHLPVHICKKLYPRQRPYMRLPGTKHHHNPLTDHSFPSGHTTAIFAITLPFASQSTLLALLLLPLAGSVGISRIYLGLHYPSDVLAGSLLGTVSGLLSCYIVSLLSLSV